MLSHSKVTYSSHVRYAGDFLTRLEGEYWQKRINQLKYEFANSREQLPVFFEHPQGSEPVPATPSSLTLPHARLSQPQRPYPWPKPPVARPIIRRVRSQSQLL